MCDGNKIGQGKANTQKFLSENPKIKDDLEKAIRDKTLQGADFAVSETAPRAVSASLKTVTPERRVDSPTYASRPAPTAQEPKLTPDYSPKPSLSAGTLPDLEETVSVGSNENKSNDFADDFLTYRDEKPSSTQNPVAPESSREASAPSLSAPVAVPVAIAPVTPAAAPKPQAAGLTDEPEWFKKAYDTEILKQQRAWVVYQGKGLVKGRMTALEHIENTPQIKSDILSALAGMGHNF